MISKLTAMAASVLALAVHAPLANAQSQFRHLPHGAELRHVLLISVDGMHALDLERYVQSHPDSALAELSRHGVRYTGASSTKPSDSFPGLLAMVTGGTPLSTGVYYDDSFDRSFFPPGTTNCTGTPGAEVVFDESIDDATHLGINPALLPIGPDCRPVYPHQFLKVNTVFEVVKRSGRRTAWADKHPAYDLVNGPSGKGVDDLYTPEITIPDGADATTSVVSTADNDALKVEAVVNELKGRDHTGGRYVGVPAVLGMNFQAVSVGQKLAMDAIKAQPGGYRDADGTPSTVLAYGLDRTDAALGRMVATLKSTGLYDSTLVIVSAKHGQAPIDPARSFKAGKLSKKLAATPLAGAIAQVTEDDVALIWLKDASKTQAVADLLRANQAAWNIQDVLSGPTLTLRFNDPTRDTRTPDIIVLPNAGTIFTSSGKKNAEHGGFSDADTNVALLVSNPGLAARVIKSPVQTTQIAPTILEALGLEPRDLMAVRREHTTVLPGLRLGEAE